ncbi:MAG TPA: hypothetical protein VKA98_02430 [Nitrososphaeraceae archaeon]|nr:hypothetical protein [Nitrososphaeraceae archaeon]
MNFFRKFIKNAHRKKLQTDSDAIFSLSSTYISLQTKLGLKSTGRCAICVEKVSGSHFGQLKQYIDSFLDSIKANFELSYSTLIDKSDYLWIIIDAKRIEDIVACVTAVGEIIEERGFSGQLLSAVIEFSDDDDGIENPYYLIYNYKLDSFYPFVPTNTTINQRRRNNQAEMKIMAAVTDDKLPFEKDMTHWYPIWDLPL